MKIVGDLNAQGQLSAGTAESATTDAASLAGQPARFAGGSTGQPSYGGAVLRDFIVDEDGSFWGNGSSGWVHHGGGGSGSIYYKKPVTWASWEQTFPSSTYDNGSSGVGATLTATANGQLVTPESDHPATGDSILITNHTYFKYNGIYDVTDAGSPSSKFILTRRDDADQANQFVGSVVLVQLGYYASISWYYDQTATPTIGTTALTYTFLGANALFMGGNPTSLASPSTGDVVHWDGINYSPLAQSSLNTNAEAINGAVISGSNIDGGAPVYVSASGEYVTKKLLAKYAVTIGDGTTTSFTITHNLGTTDICSVFVYELSSGDHQAQVDVAIVDTNNLTVTFAVAPSLNDYRVIVTG